MLIQATTGNENFQNCSAKSYVFVVSSRDHPREEEVTLGQAVGSPGIATHGSKQVLPAAPGYRQEFGKWTTATYDVPEGMILKVFGTRKRAEQVAGRHMTANVYIQMRHNAPLNKVSVILTGDPRAQYQQVHVEGRFDVLTLAQARAEGVVPNRKFASTFSQDHVDLMFEVTEVAPEMQARTEVVETVVENSAGKKVTVSERRGKRALDI